MTAFDPKRSFHTKLATLALFERRGLDMRSTALAFFMIGAAASNLAWAVTLPAFDLPEIGSIDLPKSAKAGDSVQITIKASKDGTSVCGLALNFGDGTLQQVKINADNAKLPLSVEHTYKKPGKYKIQASGKKITTHHSCKGNASALITVSGAKKSAKASKSKN